MQVVLSGFSVRLLCFVRSKTLCRYMPGDTSPGVFVLAGVFVLQSYWSRVKSM